MLKTAGAVLVIFSCTALGYQQSMRLSKRQHQLMEIRKMLLLLLGEITYRRETLPEAMNRISGKIKEPFCGFLREAAQEADRYGGERFSDIFSEKAKSCLKDSQMTKEDLEDFARLGECLGYLDVNMQKNTVELYLELLKKEITQISEEMPVKKKLYQSMGLLGGVFLAVLLV